MKITCDNCGAVYKIPEEKLTKSVSRATCKKCGFKIEIRRPAESGGMGQGYDFEDEDDGVVNHEERTVIATVPELQRFDATPPLSVPGAAPTAAVSAAPAAAPSAAAAQARVPETARASAAPTAREPERAPTPPTNGAAEAAAPVNGASPTQPMAAIPTVRPGGVPIPSQSQIELGGVPFAMVALAIVGTLLFLPHQVWSAKTTSGIGFFAALFGEVAVLMALLDIKRQRKVDLRMVLGVPLAVCVLLFLALLLFQGKENMAFLNPGQPERVALIEDVPGVEGLDWEYREVVDETTGQKKTVKVRKPRAAQPLPAAQAQDVSAPSETGLGEQQAMAAMVPDPSRPGFEGMPSLSKERPGAPGGGTLDQRAVAKAGVSSQEVSAALSGDRSINQCFLKYQNRNKLSGRLDFEVVVAPSGKVQKAGFKSPEYQMTELERCVAERARQLSFTAFNGTASSRVEHTFIF